MEPVRIKLYGLFWMTKRRYLFQAVFGAALAVLLLVGWYLTWPGPHGLGVRLKQPPPGVPESALRTVVVVLIADRVPWILLAALAYQAAEVYLVLRLFARRAAAPPAPKAGGSPKPG